MAATVADRVAGALLVHGDEEGARNVLEEAVTRLAETTMAVRTLHLPELVRVCGTMSETRLAAALVHELEPPSAPRMRAAVLTARASVAEIQQLFQDASAGYHEALPLWDAGGCVVESTHARAGLGRSLLGLGREEEGRAELVEARGTSADLGAARWIDDIDAWLDGDTALTS